MARILIVEDDQPIREALTRELATRGHEVAATGSGMDGLRDAVQDRPDIVVLDLGLPDVAGADVLRMLRATSDSPAVLVATARDDEDEIVRVLDLGADDYLVKPFSVDQLEARIRAVLRRLGDASVGSSTVEVGGLVIDSAARQARLDGVELELSRKEFDLLELLARRAGEVVTRRELLAEVWRQPHGGADKTIDVHLSWLRRKLGETAADPVYLHTVRGVGVRLAAPAT